MRRFSAFIFAGVFLITLCGCGGGGNGIGPVTVQFTSTAGTVPGGANFVFSVTTQNDTQNRGVNFSLALNAPSNGSTTTPCTTACGALTNQSNVATANGPETFTSTTTVNYAAPLLPPNPNSLILTATSVTNASVTTTTTFTIGAPQIVVRITNKITNIQPGAAPVTLNAQVQFDTANAGVTWALTAQGAACSPACGTLSNPQPLSVVYTPPASLPAAPNNTPTITATSVTDTTRSDFDDLRIEAPTQPISVAITNPFAQINAGSPGVAINAIVNNDVAGQGVTWSLEPAAQTGALSAEQPLSVIYTPPNTAPQPSNNAPTITATSVADPTKSDSFTFTIEPAQPAFVGAYAFLIRGQDNSGHTFAAAGSLTSDGAGKITTGEMDLNAAANTPENIAPFTGTYKSTSSDSAGNSLRIQLNAVTVPGDSTPLSFAADFFAVAPASLPASSAAPNRGINFSLGEISGQSGPWTLTGEIQRQALSAAMITSFTGRDISLDLRRNGSSASVSIDFTLSASGEVLRGLLYEFNVSRNTTYEICDVITDGELGSFDRSGRADLTLVQEFWRDARHFAIYAVSPTNLILVETDATESPSTGTTSRIAQSH